MGGIVAGGLFVIPSFFILVLLSWVYIAFGDLPLVEGVFYGIKPAITAVVLFSAHRIGVRVLKNYLLWMIALTSFLAILIFQIPFPVIVVFAGLIGMMGSRFAPEIFLLGIGHIGHKSVNKNYGTALIDDHTQAPAHAQFRLSKLFKVLILGSLLWALPMGFLTFTYGWNNPLTQMSWFFTKAALLTFGGAYAVLPYVYQGAVTYYGWLSPTQMIDGLALGETTPGPLIMVVAFVGFVGGYNQALFGEESLFIAGAVAAGLVTWFTFLPSFIFILVGAPLVESTQDEIKFTAPLTAITAAVVGVILNLALFFSYHVFFPQGINGCFDWISALITLVAAVTLFYFNRRVMEVIFFCAIVGLLISIFINYPALLCWET